MSVNICKIKTPNNCQSTYLLSEVVLGKFRKTDKNKETSGFDQHCACVCVCERAHRYAAGVGQVDLRWKSVRGPCARVCEGQVAEEAVQVRAQHSEVTHVIHTPSVNRTF